MEKNKNNCEPISPNFHKRIKKLPKLWKKIEDNFKV